MTLNTSTLLETFVAHWRERIEQQLDALIPKESIENLPYSVLFDAARYSLLGGGKRLRALLTLATAEMLGESPEKAMVPACALEMVHAYSLIHDDLPCMDDDDFRRGKPSLHKAYPEGHAVLAGDFLLTHAFDVLANSHSFTADQKVQFIASLSNAAGGHGMIAGQIMDLSADNTPISIEHLNLIHRKKTAAMIRAACEFGAIASEASAAHLATLRHFGELIGLAFQIVDDVLDAPGQEEIPTAISSDQANGKTTYVTLLGVQSAQSEAKQLWAAACDCLKQLPFDSTLLQAMAASAVIRTN